MIRKLLNKKIGVCAALVTSFLLGGICYHLFISYGTLNGSIPFVVAAKSISNFFKGTDWALVVASISALATAAAAVFTAKAAKAAQVSASQWRHQAVYDKYLDKAISARASLKALILQLEKIDGGLYDIGSDASNEIDKYGLAVRCQMIAEDLVSVIDENFHSATQELEYAHALSNQYIECKNAETQHLEYMIGLLKRALKVYRDDCCRYLESCEREEPDLQNMRKFLTDDTRDVAFFGHLVSMMRFMSDYLTHKIIQPNEDRWDTSFEQITDYMHANASNLTAKVN
ncbi:hypothetical protein [Vibrio coralliilyticus]|uniref:hypothetical protein n=1 Tax=Vibrio coralliilyticus TaxID=190893 RepID=UPI002409CD76|nr:hypothetical protein [Vibrio coralliilyticus]WFB47868.1 hypothetical protein P6988_01195 [Vibrio coralliilyticus]